VQVDQVNGGVDLVVFSHGQRYPGSPASLRRVCLRCSNRLSDGGKNDRPGTDAASNEEANELEGCCCSSSKATNGVRFG
jgi:hypothetical protein